ncbi:MAG: flagellar motor switch protein FliG [Chloroflexi bacterium]|nr:flagellar motor switch protein FliG [Chloroflexota bacterium]
MPNESSEPIAAPGIVLTGEQKAAIFLASMGVEHSAEVLKYVSEEHLEKVMLSLSSLGPVQPDLRFNVMMEALNLMDAAESLQVGGIEYAKQLLSRAVGQRRGSEILERITAHQLTSFDFVRAADPAQVAGFLQDEHPQTISVVMSYLEPKQAGAVMAALPEQMRGEVALRIARMDRISPQVVSQVEKGLERKLSAVVSPVDMPTAGGVTFLIKILNQVDRGTEKSILQGLESSNPQLAEDVRSKMFTFEDLVKLDDRSVQRILRDVNKQDLLMALKGASEEVRNLIFRNMSSRAAQTLREELEISGPARLKNVYEAQKRVVEVVRALEAAEEIVIQREGQSEYVG